MHANNGHSLTSRATWSAAAGRWPCACGRARRRASPPCRRWSPVSAVRCACCGWDWRQRFEARASGELWKGAAAAATQVHHYHDHHDHHQHLSGCCCWCCCCSAHLRCGSATPSAWTPWERPMPTWTADGPVAARAAVCTGPDLLVGRASAAVSWRESARNPRCRASLACRSKLSASGVQRAAGSCCGSWQYLSLCVCVYVCVCACVRARGYVCPATAEGHWAWGVSRSHGRAVVRQCVADRQWKRWICPG